MRTPHKCACMALKSIKDIKTDGRSPRGTPAVGSQLQGELGHPQPPEGALAWAQGDLPVQPRDGRGRTQNSPQEPQRQMPFSDRTNSHPAGGIYVSPANAFIVLVFSLGTPLLLNQTKAHCPGGVRSPGNVVPSMGTTGVSLPLDPPVSV